MQYGLWSFQTGGTKLERFLPKNQHSQRKFLNFENWTNGSLSSLQKSEFLSLLFHSSIIYGAKTSLSGKNWKKTKKFQKPKTCR